MLVRFLTSFHPGLKNPVFVQKKKLCGACSCFNLKMAKNGFFKPRMKRSKKTD